MKKVVFDVDDILWGLNERVAKITGIPVSLLEDFVISENKRLTERQKESILKAYRSPGTFEDMVFYKGVERIPVLEAYGFEVHISSNKLSEETAAVQLMQLKRVIKLPEDRFHMHIIGVENAHEKEMLSDVFIYAEDSPYNLQKSKAEHNLCVNHPWNMSEAGRAAMRGVSTRRFDAFEDLMNHAVLLCYHERAKQASQTPAEAERNNKEDGTFER